MKQSYKVVQILFAAILFSLVATVSFADRNNPVMTEDVFYQWSDTNISQSANPIIVTTVKLNGPVMKESTWEQWPGDNLTPTNHNATARTSTIFSRGFGIGTSVMKESTWEQWPNYDESMTE